MAATLRTLPMLFDLETLEIHEGTSVLSASPLSFVTPTPAWAYAVWIKKAQTAEALTGPVAIRIHMRTLAGEIGVGCLAGDGTQFLDESLLPAGDAETTVDLLVSDFSQCGWLVFRNASHAGRSEARIGAMSCMAVSIGKPDSWLTLPPGAKLRPMKEWNRFYGSPGVTVEEKLRVSQYLLLQQAKPMSWIENLQVMIHPQDQLSRALYVSGLYEPNTMMVMRRLLKPGGVFVDVGAHQGIFSLVAARWVGPEGAVFSFEPSEREFGRLHENIALNTLRTITARRLAVDEAPGSVNLQVAEPPYSGMNTTGAGFAYDGIRCLRVETVPTISLDVFQEERGLQRIDLIKVDVEGAELRVLRGAGRVLARQRPALIIEVSPEALLRSAGTEPSALEHLLQEVGYTLFGIEPDTASLRHVDDLRRLDSENLVALPEERSFNVTTGSGEPPDASAT